MSSIEDDILSSDLEDDILGDDDLDDDLEADDLDEGDGDSAELGEDYAISDQNVRALSGERGAALMRPTVLGSAVHLDGVPSDSAQSLEKLLRGGSSIKLITIQFANGRKLYIKP